MLIKFGGGVLDARGSIGGNTFARNRYGNYARSRTKPVNPNSSRQQQMRAILGGLVEYWRSTLTVEQRAAWNQYGANVNWLNKLGESVKLAGFNHFTRSNSVRLLAGLGVLADGPTELTLPAADETANATISAGTGNLSVSFDDSLEWVDEDGGALLVSVSIPQGEGRVFLQPQFRYAGVVLGDATTPPTSPASIACPWEIAAGQQCLVQFRILRADGRVSMPFFRTVTIGS